MVLRVPRPKILCGALKSCNVMTSSKSLSELFDFEQMTPKSIIKNCQQDLLQIGRMCIGFPLSNQCILFFYF